MPTQSDSSTNPQILNLAKLTHDFSDDDQAREFLESVRWPDGAVCPKCGLIGEATKLTPRPNSKRPVRKGVWKCNGCRAQFTVTVGSIFEDSHLPLRKWLMGFHLMCASKKGMSAHQLHRMLGVTYRTAWFMAHRIRPRWDSLSRSTSSRGRSNAMKPTLAASRASLEHRDARA